MKLPSKRHNSCSDVVIRYIMVDSYLFKLAMYLIKQAEDL